MAWFPCLILAWPNFRASWVGHKRSFGTKTHIFEKYHFQLKIPIRNMFNLFLKKTLWQHISLAQPIHLSSSSCGLGNTSLKIFFIKKLGGWVVFEGFICWCSPRKPWTLHFCWCCAQYCNQYCFFTDEYFFSWIKF